MAKTKTASFTDRYMKSPKFWLTVNFASTLALSIAILISLLVGGYKAQYMIFPSILIATDVLFLTVSLLSNFRFGHTVITPILYLAISVITTVLTVYIDGGIGGTRLFTHAAIYVFLFIHLIAAVAWVFSYVYASTRALKKTKARITAAALGMILVACCGIYGYAVFQYGWFGQGSFGVERAVEYTWNEQTGKYDVIGLGSERGDTVVIPATFNGAPIGTVDCTFAEDNTIKHIYFESEDITTNTFVSADSLYSVKGDRTIYGSVFEDNSMPLQNAFLEFARTKKDLVYLNRYFDLSLNFTITSCCVLLPTFLFS